MHTRARARANVEASNKTKRSKKNRPEKLKNEGHRFILPLKHTISLKRSKKNRPEKLKNEGHRFILPLKHTTGNMHQPTKTENKASITRSEPDRLVAAASSIRRPYSSLKITGLTVVSTDATKWNGNPWIETS
jgi:hypothetical protein